MHVRKETLRVTTRVMITTLNVLMHLHVTCPKVPRVEERHVKLKVVGHYITVITVESVKGAENELNAVGRHLRSATTVSF